MTGVLLSFASVVVATLLGLAGGVLLGRLGLGWPQTRGLVNVLTQMRSIVLPFLGVPVLLHVQHLPSWLVIALIVGAAQAIAVARWILRPNSDWSPALAGGVALGHSGTSLEAQGAAARGAVAASLGTTALYVVGLEATLAWLSPSPAAAATLGVRLLRGPAGSALLDWLLTAAFVLLCEALASRILQGKSRHWARFSWVRARTKQQA